MDHNALAKLMKKKEGAEPLDENYKNAKMSMLEALRDEMHGMMKGDLDGAKKVEVLSDSAEGLKHGLDKAKDIVAEKASEDEESPEHESEEGPEAEAKEDGEDYDSEEGSKGDASEPSDDHDGIQGDEEDGEDEEFQKMLSGMSPDKLMALKAHLAKK